MPEDSSPVRRVFSALTLSELAANVRGPRPRPHPEPLLRRNLPKRVAALVAKWKGRYALHEQLLLLWFSRHDGDRDRNSHRFALANPLSVWRAWWRWAGVLLLLLHGVSAGAGAWVYFRCDSDPLCERACPTEVTEWASYMLSPRPGTGVLYGCRRELALEVSTHAVRAFAAGEVALGMLTASTMRPRRPERRSPSHHSGFLGYGTHDGLAARSLLVLDLCLLTAPWRAVPRSLPSLRSLASSLRSSLPTSMRSLLAPSGGEPPATAADNDEAHGGGWTWWPSWLRLPLGTSADPTELEWWQHEWWQQEWWRQEWWPPPWLAPPLKDLRRAVRSNHWVRTLSGYRRLVALPRAPEPIQALIDSAIATLLPTSSERLAALPTVGDILLEGAFLQVASLPTRPWGSLGSDWDRVGIGIGLASTSPTERAPAAWAS